MKKFLVAAILASTIFTVSAVSASAMELCMSDPAVAIKLPDGTTTTVYVTEYAMAPKASDVRPADITYTVDRDQRGFDVDMKVTIPATTSEPFRTWALVSTLPDGAGQILARASGVSGRAMELDFILPGAPALVAVPRLSPTAH